MKKIPFFAGLLGLLVSSFAAPVAADDCCWSNNDCCDWSFCDGKFKVTADWLYWKVEQRHIPLATEITTDLADLTVVTRSTTHQKPKYRSGFRVGVGFEIPNAWELNVNYYYMPVRANGTTFVDTDTSEIVLNDIDFPVLSNFTTLAFSDFASKWNSNINNLDVDLGRKICFGECFYIYPHFGFRAFWFKQNLRFLASTASGSTSAVLAGKFEDKFTGYGVEAGLKAVWEVGGGFGVVGHFGGSILYSRHKVHERAALGLVTTDIEDPTFFLLSEQSNNPRFGTPSFDYYLGVQYASNFCDFDLNVHVGWEQHVWLDVNQIAHCGNLSAQGLTLGVDVAF